MKSIFRILFPFVLLQILISCEGVTNHRPENTVVIPEGYALLKGKLEAPEGIDPSEIQNADIYVVGQKSEAVKTDSQGNFSLLIDTNESGGIVPRASGIGSIADIYQIVSTSATGETGQKVDDIIVTTDEETVLDDTIEVSLTGSLSGKVVLDGQTDFSGIDVYIPGTSFIAKTDATGSYSISDIPEGRYDFLRAEKDGYNFAIQADVIVNSDQNMKAEDMVLYLETGADGSFVINNGDSFSTSQIVDIRVTASEDAVLMMMSEDNTFTGAQWQKLETAFEYDFTSNGYKTLYMRLANTNGLENTLAPETIEINTNPRVALTSPIGVVSSTQPVFSWNASPIAGSHYHFQLATDSSFDTIIVEESNLSSIEYTLTEILENQSNYYWRVSIIDDIGTEWNWSESASFQVDLGSVTLLSPNDQINLNDRNPTFSWSDVTYAENYTFRLSKNQDMSSPVLNITGITGTEYTLGAEEALTDSELDVYYWNVTPVDKNGVSGNDSEIRKLNFDNVAPSGAFTINNGDADTYSETVSIDISASDVSGITEMYISTDNSFTDGIWESFIENKSGIELSAYLTQESATMSVYIKLKDSFGNISETISDSIELSRTFIEGQLLTDTTWSSNDSPYVLTGVIQLAYGVSLTIEAGTEIYGFDNDIQVWGDLLVQGSGEAYASFENVNIVPGNGPTDEFFSIIINYAKINSGSVYSATGNAVYGSIEIYDSVLKDIPGMLYIWYPMEDCYFERNIFLNSGGISIGTSGDIGIYIRNNVFYNQQLTDSNMYAVQNWASYNPSHTTVEYNSFLSTDRIALDISNGNISGINNYWNTTDEAVIEDMINDKNDNFSLAYYTPYTPYLTEAHADTPDPSAYIE